MEIRDAIAALIRRDDLSRSDASELMGVIMRGEATAAQIGSILTALAMKGETVEEITGFAATMREFSTKVPTSRKPLVDTCGTGGDRSGSFNISTTVAFVVAGAGVAVAKHGNRSATSKCGSADVLEALGVNIDLTPAQVGQCIDEVGIGFLFARALHGAMKHVAGPRVELRIPTVFNFLGPLTNPAGADGQIVGVFDAYRISEIANVLTNLGTRHAFVVAGSDGLDEITLSGPTFVAESKEGKVGCYEISPRELGLSTADARAMKGGEANENASILRSVLGGEEGPRRDIVLANAAAALQAGEAAETWGSGLAMARESIDSRAAMSKLEALISMTSHWKKA